MKTITLEKFLPEVDDATKKCPCFECGRVIGTIDQCAKVELAPDQKSLYEIIEKNKFKGSFMLAVAICAHTELIIKVK